MIKNLLILTLLVPLFGFLGILCINKQNERNIQNVSAWTSLFAFLLTLIGCFAISTNLSINVFFMPITISRISLYFMTLTSFIIFICTLISRKEITRFVKTFYTSIIGFESVSFFLFLSNNIVICYILLSIITLIVFLLVRIFVSQFATKFFILQTVGLLVMLLGIACLVHITGLTEIGALAKYTMSLTQEHIIFWALMSGLIVQSAMFPLHLYTADITSEAPSTLSIIISGIYSKISVFCILSIVLPIVPHACASYQMLIFVWCIISIFCGVAGMIFLQNLKQVVAHIDIISSAVIIFGAFVLNTAGAIGSLICVGAYGLTISALFYFVYLIEKYCDNCTTHNTSIMYKMPKIALLAEIPVLSIGAIPLFPCFLGEFSILSACFDAHPIACCLFGAALLAFNFFAFVMFQRIIFGEKTEQKEIEKYDLTIMGIFAVLIAVFGIGLSITSKFATAAIEASPIKEIYKNVSL